MRGAGRAGAVAAYANWGATSRANDRPAHDDAAGGGVVLRSDAHVSLPDFGVSAVSCFPS